MPRDADPIDRHRQEREEREAAKRHPAAEPSEPPEPAPRRRTQTLPEWPPEPIEDRRPGSGSPSSPPEHERIDATKKSFVGVWGVLVVIFSAASAGWAARAFYDKQILTTAINDALRPVVKSQEDNQRDIETTFAGVQKDIEWLKREQKVAGEQPIVQEKKRK